MVKKMLFNNIIGHLDIREKLIRSIENGSFPHASLIVGEDGIGKSKIAREIAINILGKSEFKDYVDIEEYKIPENKKSFSVDQVRSIIEEVNKKPYESDKKVIIVHDSDKMTAQAQNALLKTIEEPPKGVFLILLCGKKENILDTINSRCQSYKLARVSDDDIKEILLRDNLNISSEYIEGAKVFSGGIPGRAEDFINNSLYRDIRENTLKILIESNENDLTGFLKHKDFLVKNKDLWQEVLTSILSYARDIIIYKEVGKDSLIMNVDKVNLIKQLAETFSYRKLNNIIDIVNDTKNNFKSNVNAASAYHIMLVKIQEV